MNGSSDFSNAYRSLLKRVLESPEEANARTGALVRVGRGGVSLSVDLSDGLLPTIGLRRTFPRSAAAEVAWFLLGDRNVSFIQRYAPLWDKFAEDLGPNDFGVRAMYGYRWRRHFGRDQMQLAVDTLRRDPSDRRCYVSAWDPSEDGLGRAGQLNVPCPVGFSLSVTGGELHSTLTLRSSDVFVGLPYDVMGHALLMDAVASELLILPGVMHVALAHAHLYEDHWGMATEALQQLPVLPAFPLPRWPMSKIVGRPNMYVEGCADVAKQLEWPKYNPRPQVVV